MCIRDRYKVDPKYIMDGVYKDIRGRVRTAMSITERKVETLMKEELSGTISSLELRRMGHPYARRHKLTGSHLIGRTVNQAGFYYMGALPINRQTGKLAKSLKIRSTSTWYGFSKLFYFSSPHAIVLSQEGTRNMIARGYWDYINKHSQNIMALEIQTALNK